MNACFNSWYCEIQKLYESIVTEKLSLSKAIEIVESIATKWIYLIGFERRERIKSVTIKRNFIRWNLFFLGVIFLFYRETVSYLPNTIICFQQYLPCKACLLKIRVIHNRIKYKREDCFCSVKSHREKIFQLVFFILKYSITLCIVFLDAFYVRNASNKWKDHCLLLRKRDNVHRSAKTCIWKNKKPSHADTHTYNTEK